MIITAPRDAYKAPFTLALKPVSNLFTFKPVWPNHIHYVVYRKRFKALV